MLSEEKRLATVVLAITQECWTVPRGAYHLDAVKKIRLNPLFSGKIDYYHSMPKHICRLPNLKGLRRYEAKQALSYLHFKRSSDALKVVSQMRKDVEQSIDIFVPIANDEPKGIVVGNVRKYAGYNLPPPPHSYHDIENYMEGISGLN